VRRVVLATRNGHKVRELQTILADLIEELDLEIVGMGEFPDVA
jgi:XTP/dITP diphosphohydrolase